MEPDADKPPAAGDAPEPGRWHQPKAALCRMLAVLWFFPSAGAVLILVATEARWRQAEGWLAALGAVSFEQWIALAMLVAHPVFAWLAWRWRQTEPWKELAPEPDPDADLQDAP